MRKNGTQAGLAFGLACFMMALFWMRYETTYDGFLSRRGAHLPYIVPLTNSLLICK